MRLLVIEDDPEILDYIRNGLTEHGHEVASATDGNTGLSLASEGAFDAIVVDRMLPHLDGLSLIKALRAADNRTPILILSALAQVDDRITGLRAGGDDYLVKPFSFPELLARIEALGRRYMTADKPTTLRVADLEMDLLTRTVTRAGDVIDIQAREFRLLEYMLRHKGQVVTRTMLLEHVWDYNFDPQTNVIDVHVSRLRSKLNRNSQVPLIRTIRGTGYSIDDPD